MPRNQSAHTHLSTKNITLTQSSVCVVAAHLKVEEGDVARGGVGLGCLHLAWGGNRFTQTKYWLYRYAPPNWPRQTPMRGTKPKICQAPTIIPCWAAKVGTPTSTKTNPLVESNHNTSSFIHYARLSH